jgi:hypothetical protein
VGLVIHVEARTLRLFSEFSRFPFHQRSMRAKAKSVFKRFLLIVRNSSFRSKMLLQWYTSKLSFSHVQSTRYVIRTNWVCFRMVSDAYSSLRVSQIFATSCSILNYQDVFCKQQGFYRHNGNGCLRYCHCHSFVDEARGRTKGNNALSIVFRHCPFLMVPYHSSWCSFFLQ